MNTPDISLFSILFTYNTEGIKSKKYNTLNVAEGGCVVSNGIMVFDGQQTPAQPDLFLFEGGDAGEEKSFVVTTMMK